MFVKPITAVTVAFLALGLSACGGGKAAIAPEQSAMKKEGVISMNVEWVKDKRTKYDIRLILHNESSGPIIVKLGDMQCYRGERQGILHHTFFNTGERTIDFRVGQSKVFQMVCDLGTKAEGDYRIIFGRVFDNPANDGATIGKVISESIEWKASDKG
jgi:hypothetical protein